MYHARSAATQIGRVRGALAPTSWVWSVHRARRGPPRLTFEAIGAPSSWPLVSRRLRRGRRHVQASGPRPYTHQTQQRDCVSSTTFSGATGCSSSCALSSRRRLRRRNVECRRARISHVSGFPFCRCLRCLRPVLPSLTSRRMPHEANSGGLGSTARGCARRYAAAPGLGCWKIAPTRAAARLWRQYGRLLDPSRAAPA